MHLANGYNFGQSPSYPSVDKVSCTSGESTAHVPLDSDSSTYWDLKTVAEGGDCALPYWVVYDFQVQVSLRKLHLASVGDTTHDV